MRDLLGLLFILSGGMLALAGLLMIAPQVRRHEIQVYSWRSWLFRAGMLLTLIGMGLLWGDYPELATVGLLIGITGVLGGLITWNHERAQALHAGLAPWHWRGSLTLHMLVLGGVVCVAALATL